MALSEDGDVVLNLEELTLEDTYERLQKLKHEKEEEIKRMMAIARNNEVRTLGPDITPEEIRRKRAQYVQAMQKLIAVEEPKYLPNPNTLDFYVDALKKLEDEVRDMEELNKITDKEIAELRADISYVEKKIFAFEQIKEASLNAENHEKTNYEAEMVVTKQLFQEAKKDLSIVVDALFPGNVGFQEFLCVLTRAMSKGGDDLYVDVTPNVLDFVSFLNEADIIQFHPNDGKKVKLANL